MEISVKQSQSTMFLLAAESIIKLTKIFNKQTWMGSEKYTN